MNGGSIAGSEANLGGEDVDWKGSFTMNGGSLCSNISHGSGGGVYVYDGDFTMNGGEITDNLAGYGGGVYMEYGTMTVTGGAITGNTAYYYGGGIYMNDGMATVTGGAITGNTVLDSEYGCGGGIDVYYGTLTLGGEAVVEDNLVGTAKNDVEKESAEDALIVLGTGANAPVADTMKVGLYGAETVVTGATDAEQEDLFFPDDAENFTIKYKDGTIVLQRLPHVHENADFITPIGDAAALKKLFDEGGSGFLTEYFEVFDYEQDKAIALTVAEDKTVDLCLNGYVIDLCGEHITVGEGETLNLYDCGKSVQEWCKEEETGLWTRMYTGVPAGTTTGGALTGGGVNGTQEYGGAVYVDGGTFTMDGGALVGNTATNGGAVAVTNGGSSTLTNVRIIGNMATAHGGGVDLCSGTLTLGGRTVIKGNLVGTAANDAEYRKDTDPVTVNLSETARPAFGTCVGLIGDGVKVEKAQDGDEKYFFSDDPAFTPVYVAGQGGMPLGQSLGTVELRRPKHEHEDVTFLSWDEDDKLPTNAGSYYLLKDIELEDNWTVGANIDLCLNGHVINLKGHNITVAGSKELNIYDCGKTEHYFEVGADGLWKLKETDGEGYKTVTGGVITGGSADCGGAVHIGNGGNYGSFVLYGGTLVGNKASGTNGDGGAVYVEYGSVKMYGGAIVGNTAVNGGGVFSNSSFDLYGGSVTGNTATANGGGVYMNDSYFTMTGGSITGNTAKLSGGGVYSIDAGDDITLTGGSITGNTAGNYGGGLYVEKNDVTLGGTPVVRGNTADGKPRDLEVYLYGYGDGTITIDSTVPPAPGMCVGLYEVSSDMQITNAQDGEEQYFFADADDKYVKFDDNNTLDTDDDRIILATIESGNYKIAVEVTGNGAVYADPQVAAQNAEITLTVVPAPGYMLKADSLTVNDSTEGITDKNNGTYTFTMPNAPVTVTAEFVPVAAKIGTTPYASVEAALVAANNGDTVTVVADVTETTVVAVPTGVTLDLDGHTLTALGVTVFGTGLVKDGKGGARLITAQNAFIYTPASVDVTTDSPYSNQRILPVWDGSGYIFCGVKKIGTAWATDEADRPRFKFTLYSDEIETVLAEDSGVRVGISLDYTKGEPNTKDYVVGAQYVNEYVEAGADTHHIYASFTGTDGITAMSARTYLEACGLRLYSGTPKAYTFPQS